jgi:hypothetical protein
MLFGRKKRNSASNFIADLNMNEMVSVAGGVVAPGQVGVTKLTDAGVDLENDDKSTTNKYADYMKI